MSLRRYREIAAVALALVSASAGYAAAIYSARNTIRFAHSLSMAELLRVEAEQAHAAFRDKLAPKDARMWALKHHLRVLRSVSPSEPFLPKKALQTDIALTLGRLGILHEELGDVNTARRYYAEAIEIYNIAQGTQITREVLVSLIRSLKPEPRVSANSPSGERAQHLGRRE